VSASRLAVSIPGPDSLLSQRPVRIAPAVEVSQSKNSVVACDPDPCIQYVMDIGSSFEHSENLICRFHVREDVIHGFQLALVCLSGNLGHGVASKDHAVIMFDPTANSAGDACGDPGHNASSYAHIAKNRIEFGVRKPSEALSWPPDDRLHEVGVRR
jgi:hypothetical protein